MKKKIIYIYSYIKKWTGDLVFKLLSHLFKSLSKSRPNCYIVNISVCLSHNVYRAMIVFLFVFLAFEFCRFCMIIRFFHQRQMTSNFEGFSIPDCIHYILFPILILQKEPVFPCFNVECRTRKLLVRFL